jgi:O-antigen/teichoic acid export membrane protein
MTLKKNIVANYLGIGTAALAPILALPWYLSALGSEQFGLVSFVLMLQAVLGLIDAGMSQALVREVTVRFNSAEGGRRSTASLLYGFERIYWIFAMCAGCATFLLSDVIASNWLKLNGISVLTGKEAIYGAAVIFAVQFPGSIYRSLLVGVQSQVKLNAVVLVSALIRHAGGVVVVMAWPNLATYLIWQALISLLDTLVRGQLAWKTLGEKRKHFKWDAQELRPVWRLALGMSSVTLLGALTVQMDKIILSRLTTLEQFGYYTIAATIATGALQLIYPLVQAVLPRAIQLRENPPELRRMLVKLALLISALVTMCIVFFLFLGKWLLISWLKGSPAVDVVYPVLSVLLIGTALNAFYNIGYVNWVVHEKIKKVFFVNAMSLVLSVGLIPFLVSWYGVIGAAVGWMTINLIGFMFSVDWLKRK